MTNIFLITSIINIPNNPLSYTNVRSVYNREERFSQTQKTIKTIRKSIPNIKIFLIECSMLSDEETNYLKENTDIFLNIYDLTNLDIIDKVYSHSKSMGEGTMTINALNYLLDNKIDYDNIFKMSGRYWLNDNFNFSDYDNDKIIVRNNTQPYKDYTNLYTSLYKINKETVELWLNYLKKSHDSFSMCVAFESIFANFIKTQPSNKVVYVNQLGVSGNIAVDGFFVND
jgi:hypothetical protein